MAKARMIHGKIWDSDQFNSLSIPERLLYIAIITLADDYGCFRADGNFLKRKVFHSNRIGRQKVTEMLDHIAQIGLIKLFYDEKSQNVIIGIHPGWNKYQKLRSDVRKVSDFPGWEHYVPDTSSQRLVPRRQEKGSEENINKEKTGM